ncbi:MAG: hypothetical protein LR015_00425 [Verrucomicrobia bacterium]|nr:hypothetical protein [Verrucomicrobiota bacterium]
MEALNVGNVRAGATWVFRRAGNNPDAWILRQRLQEGPEPFFGGDSVPVPNERFGAAVALSPDARSLAVGIPFNRDAQFLNTHVAMGLYQQYAAYVPQIGPVAVAASEMIMNAIEPVRKGRVVIYGFNDREGRWVREMGRSARFFSSDGWEDQFGATLAWSPDGSKLAVGAPKAAAEGRVHIFTRGTANSNFGAEGNILEPLIGATKRLIRERTAILSDIGLDAERREAMLISAQVRFDQATPQPRVVTEGAWRTASRQELIPATNYGGQGSPIPGFGTALAWSSDGTLLVGNPRRGTVSTWNPALAGN